MPKRLETEVWALDRCCGCGDCIALCSKGVLSPGPDEHPILVRREKALGLSRTILDSCTFCPQLCEMACPRLEEWIPLEAGRVVSVRTRGIVQSGEPSDVIKHLLVAALGSNLIDGAVVTDTDPWQLKPTSRVVTRVGEIMDTLGMPSYLWTPGLTALNEAVYERGLQDLAVVGTPCVSQALRKVRASTEPRLAPYRQALRLSIAAFCTGVYLSELVDEQLDGKLGMPLAQVKRIESSPRDGLLRATFWDGSSTTVPLNSVEGYIRRGCARCDDYLGESADIAVGTVGSQAGYSTLIVRSAAGDICLRTALDMGLMEIGPEVDLQALDRAAGEKDRRQRAQEFDKLVVLMLDALGEPRKRAQVRQAFVQLYETRGRSRTGDGQDSARREEGNCYVTCGQC